jgi:DNA-directed RNA polymerase specialized sigma24 family protein
VNAHLQRSLSPEAFDRLLAMLHPEREQAAEAYTRLQNRIAGLLQWWGGVDPEGLADECLDRVARKLQEGAAIAPGSFGAYVRGVARMVFYESTRRERHDPLDEVASDRPENGDPNEAERERCLASLDRCLDGLAASDRALVLRYYVDLGISATALRIRAHRLRARLEGCVQAHLARGQDK